MKPEKICDGYVDIVPDQHIIYVYFSDVLPSVLELAERILYEYGHECLFKDSSVLKFRLPCVNLYVLAQYIIDELWGHVKLQLWENGKIYVAPVIFKPYEPFAQNNIAPHIADSFKKSILDQILNHAANVPGATVSTRQKEDGTTVIDVGIPQPVPGDNEPCVNEHPSPQFED